MQMRRAVVIGRVAVLLVAAVSSALLISCGGGGARASVAAKLAFFAGGVDGRGNVDGVGSSARFNQPYAIAVDRSGNAYVADTLNDVVRKVNPSGVVTTLAGSAGNPGSTDGTGAAATLGQAYGIATDLAGNVYVADTYNYVIRRITPEGAVTTVAGAAGEFGNADGLGAAARFQGPAGIAVDRAGNVFVSDASSNVVRRITPAGEVTTLAGTPGISGNADGLGAAAAFDFPSGLATDGPGNVYVADSNNRTIRKISPSGVVTTLAGTAGMQGSADGTVANATFGAPSGVAVDVADNIYVADWVNNSVRKITPAGIVTTVAGALTPGGADGRGHDATFRSPQGIASDPDGNVYVADTFNHAIRRISADGDVTTPAGVAGIVGNSNGVAALASFNSPTGIASDSAGNLYLADTGNSLVRKITPTGEVSTVVAAGLVLGSLGATDLYMPYGIATDPAGNVYVADTFNHVIRELTRANRWVTLAGMAGTSGNEDGARSEARFLLPRGIAADSSGNVFVADTFNHIIRKISPTGEVTTLAGTAGVPGSADGIGPAAGFSYPHGMATDDAGNVYVADTFNHTVRKITAAGVVTTVAGRARITGDSDGPGAAARFNFPYGLTIDSAGDLYVADTNNHTIRRITPDGNVETIVGMSGRAGFKAGELPGVLAYPFGVAIRNHSLYITSNNGIAVVAGIID